MFRLKPIVLLLSVLTKASVALESNNEGSPQVLSDMSSSNACEGQGRTDECTIELDVPSDCVMNGESTCPIVFYLHGAGGRIDGFKRSSEVHKHGFIGVYPQGENGWNTGPKDSNDCEYTEYDCETDPNETEFIATIISEVKELGANGSVYLAGNSNGAALAHFAAVNAGTELPIKGIITTVTQLLASPDRQGPGPLNYVNPAARSNQGPKVSVLNLMGTKDGLIPYEGGSSPVFGGEEAFQLMSALDSMNVWASHNGCSTEPKVKEVNTDTQAGGDGTGVFYSWENCGSGTIVEHYAINGGNHGAGGSTVDDVKFNYDITADFIGRCEDSDPSPTVSPKPTPMPRPTKAPVTRAPVPTKPDECVDDPDWRGKASDLHDCDFVGKKPQWRCNWVSSDGVPAERACRVSCDNCEDDGEEPTSSPSAPPSPAPACPQGESLFAIELQADNRSRKENVYLIQKRVTVGNKKKWRKVKKKNKIPNNELHEFDTCLDSSLCYRFRMKDSKKNGLCCGGYYNIYYDNEELEHDDFDDTFTKKYQNTLFGNC